MPSIPGLSVCLGKKQSEILTTESLGKENSKGNFLTQPYEHAIKKAIRSKRISNLETSLAEAKSSGFMAHSKTWASAHTLLLEWKEAESGLKSKNGINDLKALTLAITAFNKLKLIDEHGYLKHAKALENTLQVIDKLQLAIKLENCESLKSALEVSDDVTSLDGENDLNERFKDLVTSAKNLLEVLKKEKAYVAENPRFPKEEIEKAIESRVVIDLKKALTRWKRVGFSRQDPTFHNGIRVMRELLESQRADVIEGLQSSLQQRNVETLKQFLNQAKEVELPEKVIRIYETMALPTLETTYKIAEEMVLCLFERKFEKLQFLVEKDNDVLHSIQTDEEPVEFFRENKNPLSEFLAEYGSLEILTSRDELIDDVRTVTCSIREECKLIFSLSQSISHGFDSQKKQIQILDDIVSNFVSELQSIAHQYGHSSSASYKYSESIKSKYFLENRPITIREFISIFVVNSESLTKAIEIARSSIQAFTNSFRMTLENITTFYRKEPEILSSSGILISDFTPVHGAEAILEIVNRYIDVTKSQKTLGLFAEPELVPRNSAEILKAISNLEGAISTLCNSKYYSPPDPGFVDLCYNRPQESNILLAVNSKNVDKIKLVLNSLQRIFPEKLILEDRKVAELRLVELRLRQADENAKLNSAKYDLCQAVNSKCESDLVRALQNNSLCKINRDDPLLHKAETELQKLRCDKSACIEYLKQAVSDKNIEHLDSGLFRAEELGILPTDSIVVKAKQEKESIIFLQNRRMGALKELGDACNCIDLHKLRFALARARVCCISNLDPAYVKAMTMLKRIEAESESIAVNHVKRINRRILNDQKDNSNPLRLIGELQGNAEMIFNEIISEERYQNICGNLKTLNELNVTIPSDISAEALRALSLIHDRQEQLIKLTNDMHNALNAKSLEGLAKVISFAEQLTQVLDLNVLANVNETYDLYATVKEVFALVELQHKREGEQSKKRDISSARRQLKKAILEKSCSRPLREAVEVFKMVCTPRQDGVKTKSGEVLTTKNVNVHIQSRKPVIPDSKPIRRTRSSVGPRQPSTKRKVGQQNALSKSNSFYMEGRRSTSPHKQPKQNLKKRPSSASRATSKQSDLTPLRLVYKNAWEDIEQKNVSLLRKAEKSLRKLEKEEESRKKEEEAKQVWEEIRKDLTEKLKQAMKSGDRADMWEAIHEFTRCFGSDNLEEGDRLILNDAHKAFNRITANQYKLNLENAIKQRNPDSLEHILYQIDNECEEYLPENDEGKFKSEVKRAHRLLEHLEEFSKLRSSVGSMTRSLISEIQSYPCPPDIVRKVMSATYLLLGEDQATIKEWKSIARLMSKVGRFSLTRRVASCDVSTISLQTAKQARSHITGLSFDRVCLINKGASTFYSWAKCTIHEVMGCNGNNIEAHPPDTPKPKPIKAAAKNRFVQRLARPKTCQPLKRNLPQVETLTKHQVAVEVDEVVSDEFYRRLARPKSAEPDYKLPPNKVPKKVNTETLVQRLAKVKTSDFMNGDNIEWRKINNFFP